MSLETWIAFCLTETVLCFIPGPAVLLVVSIALTRGEREGIRAALGILSANALYFALSALGVGALLLASWELFLAVKWLGAAYLVWLGLQMLIAPASKAEATPPAATPARSGKVFLQGFVVQGANPKALIFFTALLPQFIDPSAAVAWQVVVLGGSSVLIELAVLALYASAADRARGWAAQSARAAWLRRIGGVFLIGAGARLAATRPS